MSKCFVYLLAMTLPNGNGPIKIGIAWNPRRRWQGICMNSPFPIRLVNYWEFDTRDAARLAELRIHAELREMKLKHEWFGLPHKFAHDFIIARHGCGVLETVSLEAA